MEGASLMKNMDKHSTLNNDIDQRIQDAVGEYVEQHESAPGFDLVFARAQKQRKKRILFRSGVWMAAAAAVLLLSLLLFPSQIEPDAEQALGLYDWEAPTDQLLYSEDIWLSVNESSQNVNESTPSNLN